jgi:hypothetical protein
MREETLAEKILIGLVFVATIVLLVMMPDLVPFTPINCK